VQRLHDLVMVQMKMMEDYSHHYSKMSDRKILESFKVVDEKLQRLHENYAEVLKAVAPIPNSICDHCTRIGCPECITSIAQANPATEAALFIAEIMAGTIPRDKKKRVIIDLEEDESVADNLDVPVLDLAKSLINSNKDGVILDATLIFQVARAASKVTSSVPVASSSAASSSQPAAYLSTVTSLQPVAFSVPQTISQTVISSIPQKSKQYFTVLS